MSGFHSLRTLHVFERASLAKILREILERIVAGSIRHEIELNPWLLTHCTQWRLFVRCLFVETASKRPLVVDGLTRKTSGGGGGAGVD